MESFISVETPTGEAVAKSVRSPNGRFRIACYAGVGGGEGGVVLIEGDTALWRVKAVRPEEGRVLDSGTVLFADWLDGASLAGEFCVVSVAGAVIVRKRYRANLHTTGLTGDGQGGWVSTANSDWDDDSGVLEVFSLQTGQSLVRLQPDCRGDVRSVTREGSDWVVVSSRGVKEVHGSDRTIANQSELTLKKWELLFREGRWSALVYQVRDVVAGGMPEDLAQEFLEQVECWSKGLDASEASSGVKAVWHRALGELLEASDEKVEALREFEAAVGLDPSIGLKRRIQGLRGQLGQ